MSKTENSTRVQVGKTNWMRVLNSDGSYFADCAGGYGNQRDYEQRAALIVRAVNRDHLLEEAVMLLKDWQAWSESRISLNQDRRTSAFLAKLDQAEEKYGGRDDEEIREN